MPVISRFGQRVKLEVTNEDGRMIFSTEGLRVDFDIRIIPDFTRAKLDIYNLAPDTIKRLTTSTAFVSIYTALHDSEYKLLADRLYVSNGYEQTLVPNSVTHLFCYSKLKYDVMEKVVDVKVASPSFRNIVRAALVAGDFDGQMHFDGFPSNFLDVVPPRCISNIKGSVESILREKCKQAGVYMYPEATDVKFVYKVDSDNVHLTGFSKANTITLDSRNMRSQPEIGVASLKVSANLDAKFKAGIILDTSKLLTAAVDETSDNLEVADQLIKDKIADNQKFQILQVQHKGSNFTKEWTTSTIAYSPAKGTHMNPYGWFK